MLQIPARETRTEIRVLNSRFIGIVAPAFNVEAAKAFVEEIRQGFADATHCVPAYLIGHGASVIAHCSDDGEPSGTAGRPVLTVLQGSGMGDISAVVVRYFGGTKLGTGGLVRAYGDAIREVLKLTPRAEKAFADTLMFLCPYSLFERVRLLISEHQGQIIDQDFAAEVCITTRLRVTQTEHFQQALYDMSNGQIRAEIIQSNEMSIIHAE
jgi:uncharacterized YigZ family protein